MPMRTYAEEALAELGARVTDESECADAASFMSGDEFDSEPSRHLNQYYFSGIVLYADGNYIRRDMEEWKAFQASDQESVRGSYRQFLATWVPSSGGYWHLSTQLFLCAKMLDHDQETVLAYLGAYVYLDGERIRVSWLHPITCQTCGSLREVLDG